MTFQTAVQRNYGTGVPGDILRNGPTRSKVARIISATLGVDPGASTNRMSRAFGYSADTYATGTTNSVVSMEVIVGGSDFFGVLGNPKDHVLNGTTAGGTLAASMDLPQGAEAEFFDMCTGFCAELFNEQTGAKATTFGDQVAYAPSTITAANNPLALPYGALISVPAGAAAPTGFQLIPGARVINTGSLTASALGALVSGYTIIQLNQ